MTCFCILLSYSHHQLSNSFPLANPQSPKQKPLPPPHHTISQEELHLLSPHSHLSPLPHPPFSAHSPLSPLYQAEPGQFFQRFQEEEEDTIVDDSDSDSDFEQDLADFGGESPVEGVGGREGGGGERGGGGGGSGGGGGGGGERREGEGGGRLPSPVQKAKNLLDSELGLFQTLVLPQMERCDVSIPRFFIFILFIYFPFCIFSFLFFLEFLIFPLPIS